MSNIPTVAAFIAAWGKQDIEEIMGFFAENAIYHNIPLDPVQGIEAVRQTITQFVTMGSAIEFDTHFIAEDANGVVLTERTDKFQIKEQWLELPVMGTFEFADGKITKWRDYFDIGQFQQQLAAINAAA
ncbi:MAG TPA: limonene-1,2-epoxide hydrolase [Alphaproteobacteria bacterium]|jgi:limonene-1,2-epoxide hydrolase|nr:limonene-1,2-epoxide hydrolase [Alphaproteobacteria bacterium]HAM48522.1 limonene-1,2-epoxide hydrolase [Alphaproteobacteria bacterium]HBA41656.1 limonene-1,2-epoxide hydrolase [Alphaproteobacteria bacterium]HBC53366.1 limonene-1,2-epoxide hydrolase [Alphaproteobacteria bacterium]HCO91308.1 limonene-1,2-epoxide hydrolase [Alphaproteobacteria bacterium]